MNHVLIMVLNQLKIVFSMELEIAIQSGVYKRATKTKKWPLNQKTYISYVISFLLILFAFFERLF